MFFTARARYMTQDMLDERFKSKILLDPETKCWEWQPKEFRFRHEYHIFQPRRYALQMAGYVIPQGRNVKAGCGNDRCVNPDHTRMQHDGSKPDKGVTLFLDVGQEYRDNPIKNHDFQYSNKYIARKYHVTVSAAAKARLDTLRLIVEVKQTRLPVDRIATQYQVAPSYIQQIRRLSLDSFEEFKIQPNEDLHDDETVNPEGLKFKL